MKKAYSLIGAAALAVAVVGFLSVEPKTEAATQVGGPYTAVIQSSQGGLNGTNSSGLYPASIAGSGTGGASLIYLGSASKPFSIEIQGQTVSSTSVMVVGLYQTVGPVVQALNPNNGMNTNASWTPLQLVGYLTNSCSTTPTCTVFPITGTANTSGWMANWAGSVAAAGQSFYIGSVTNYGSGVLTNYSVSFTQ